MNVVYGVLGGLVVGFGLGFYFKGYLVAKASSLLNSAADAVKKV